MALITCPECGKQVSDKAEKCIHCGIVLKKKENASELEQKTAKKLQRKNNKKTVIIICVVAFLIVVGVVATGIFLGWFHKHEFKEATCTEPKICIKCGEKEGNPLGHTDPVGRCARCNDVANPELIRQVVNGFVECSGNLSEGSSIVTLDGTATQIYNNLIRAQSYFDSAKTKMKDIIDLCGDYKVFSEVKIALQNTYDLFPEKRTDGDKSTSAVSDWLNEYASFFSSVQTSADKMLELSTEYSELFE